MSQPTHRSYLLRLWRDDTSAPWRATLIAVALPDEPRHFPDLDALYAFLIALRDPVPECTHSTPDGD